MKLLHLPNEHSLEPKDLSYNSRAAFRELHKNEVLSKLVTFSYKHELNSSGNIEFVYNKLEGIIRKEKPDVLFWQHVSDFPVNDDLFFRLRRGNSKMLIVYYEGDVYGRQIKPFTRSLKCILRNSDMVFWVGLGNQHDLAIKAGAKNIYFAPHSFDLDRFGEKWIPTRSREFDVIMIASSGKTRIPFRYVPGGKNRLRCVNHLAATFGSRFALYGYGWSDSVSYKGSLPFNKQHDAIRKAWISANWDHFDEINFYNSNRLPISMAAGVPHITTQHRGFDLLYRSIKGGLYFADRPKDVADIARFLLSKPIDSLIEEGLMAQEFAFKHLSSLVVYENIVNKIKEHLHYSDKSNILNNYQEIALN